jgi:uncharacterized protein YeaO (DUF488 family)
VSVQVKRVYEPAADEDGVRILIDRLWPRGMSKEAARIDIWLKEIAPSHALRRWFDHDAGKWKEFQRRYAAELALEPDTVARVRALASRGRVTLLFASQELVFNNAKALCAVLSTPPKARKRETRRAPLVR